MIRDDRGSCRLVQSIAEVRALRDPEVDAVLVRRPLSQGAQRALDAAAAEWIEPVTRVLPPEPALLGAAIDSVLAGVPELARATVRVETSLAVAIMHSIVGAQPLLATLGSVVGDECAKFHQDFVVLRAIVTFAGPGTELAPREAIDPRALAHPPLDVRACNDAIVRDSTAILCACAGDLALLKGAAWQGVKHGAVHRSPAISATGARRIVLAITAVAEPRTLVEPPREGRASSGQRVLFYR